MIPVYIPCRNEIKRLSDVVESIRNTFLQCYESCKIIVIDDGSTDGTGTIARQLDCEVITLQDRGYSALGKPELADTHNHALIFIENLDEEYNYVMVSGGDTIYAPNFMEKLLFYMDNNPNIAIGAGVLKGRTPSPLTATGSGRLYRKSFLEKINFKLNRFYSWEAYPLYLALAEGYEVGSTLDAVLTVTNTPHARTNFAMYGIGMYEAGFTFPYVLGRAIKRMLTGNIKQGMAILYGRYIKAYIIRPPKYPKSVRKYIRGYQWKRIIRAITFGKLGGL